MAEYITAYDPVIKKRVLFKLKNGWAISVITGHKFKYTPTKRKTPPAKKKKGRKK